jgi:hypothetical protein
VGPVTVKGGSDAALGDYNTILEQQPDHVDALFHEGKEYQGIGKLDQAIKHSWRIAGSHVVCDCRR